MPSSSQPLLTLFTVCKPFKGHIRTIQRNAIESWSRLRPDLEVILFGDEEGIAEAAADFGVRHVPELGRNELGTPLMSELFAAAKRATSSPYIGYINADIMLTGDVLRTLRRVRWSRFLLAGRRWNVDITERWDFEDPRWEQKLREHVLSTGELFIPSAIDYFIFPRKMYDDIPAFALGRTVFDNWMIYGARASGAPVIDATEAILNVHQNHDYGHHQGGAHSLWNGPEAQENRRLAGVDQWGDAFLFTLNDATWTMSPTSLRPTLSREQRFRHWVTAPVLYPSLRPYFRTLKYLKGIRNGVLRRMGLLAQPKP